MKDVHAMAPVDAARIGLHSVGLSGVRKPLHVHRADRTVALSAEFDLAVDLPPDRKGSDLSRNSELLAEIVDRTAQRPAPSLEAACAEIARELLTRHPTARRSTVQAQAEYFLRKGPTPERASLEAYTLFAEAQGARGSDGAVEVTAAVGAEAVGMTACPCAMETCRELLLREFPLLADPRLESLPMITHNQRNRTRLLFEMPEGCTTEVDRMLAAIEAAQSAETFDILKRGDEAAVVVRAHRNPKFVEDVLRSLLVSLPDRFPELPDSVGIRAQTVSEESIHKYNVVAAHRTTFRELRAGGPT
ncbi:MAG: GTP cyclohydrolase MptA [Thermoplasmata archaeon]